MKLATLFDQTRDGQLVVVSRDLRTAAFANEAAGTLQRALDDWDFAGPRLQALYESLNQGRLRHAFRFDPSAAMAPLPRTYRWAEFDAWVDDVASDAAGSVRNLAFALRAADRLWSCRHDAPAVPEEPQPVDRNVAHATDEGGFAFDQDGPACGRSACSLDFEAGLAAIVGDLNAGADASTAGNAIRLWFGFVRWSRVNADEAGTTTRPGPTLAIAASPVACSPDEFGEHWRAGRLCSRLEVSVNSRRIGRLATGDDLARPWPGIISAAVADQGCSAGTVIAASPVRNAGDSRGYSSVRAARATLERSNTAGADRSSTTGAHSGADWIGHGDELRVDWVDDDGESWFGSVEQRVPVAA